MRTSASGQCLPPFRPPHRWTCSIVTSPIVILGRGMGRRMACRMGRRMGHEMEGRMGQ